MPDDLLGASDGEGGDEQDALVRGRLAHDLRQQPDGLLRRLVLPTAVGRLHEHVVGAIVDGRGVAQDGGAGSTQVAGEDQPTRRPCPLLHVEHDDGRAEDVTGVAEGGADARRDLARLVVLDGSEERHGGRHVVLVVEWLEVLRADGGWLRAQVRLVVVGLVSGGACPVTGRSRILRLSGGLAGLAARALLAALGLLTLDLGAVEEDQLHQLGRGTRQAPRAP